MIGELRNLAAISSGRLLDRLYGRSTDAFAKIAIERQSWSKSQLLAFQKRRLGELLLHCYDHVPFYAERLRRAGLSRAELSLDGVLERVPPTSKDDVRDHADSMRARNAPKRVITSKTSGSTGRPVVMLHDLEATAWTRAMLRRAFSWYGVDPYEPRMMLLSAPRDHKTQLKHVIVDALTGRRLFEFHDLSDDKLLEVAERIRAYRPSFITAYPSVLHELAKVAERRGLSFPGIRMLHTQSEMLYDFQKESFGRVFPGVPVMNEYSCVEVGGTSYTCPEGQLHISHDHVIVEIVREDGSPARDGEIGRVLLTSLSGRAMPLLRYEVGDEGVLDSKGCGCGRMDGLAVLSRIEGRVFEKIVGPSGERFSAGMVHFLVRRANGHPILREYLAVQRAPGAIHFLLIPADGYEETFPRRLEHEVKEHLGANMRVTTEIVPSIARKNKKKSYFSSELSASL